MGGVPCVLDAQPPAQHRQRQQRRAGQRRHRMQRTEPPWVVGNGASGAGERGCRLLDEHHAFGQREARAELLARPIEHRIPQRGLSRGEARDIGPVDQQVGGEIFADFGRDRRRRRPHAVEDRVREAGERHARRIDVLALRLPFVRNRLGKRACRDGERMPRRRFYRPAVEQEPELALGFPDPGRSIEPPRQLRPPRPARGFHGVDRLAAEEIVEDVAHGPDLALAGAARERHCIRARPAAMCAARSTNFKGFHRNVETA